MMQSPSRCNKRFHRDEKETKYIFDMGEDRKVGVVSAKIARNIRCTFPQSDLGIRLPRLHPERSYLQTLIPACTVERAERASSSSSTLLPKMSFLRLAVRSVARPRLAAVAAPSIMRSRILQQASYSAAAGLSKEQITTRVLDVLKGFEKVDAGKVRAPEWWSCVVLTC